MLLRDLWSIVSAVSGILAVAIAIFVFYQDRTDKNQRVEIVQISRTSLVNPELSSSSRRVEIVYNGRRITDYAIYQFRVSNVGGQPIRSSDYEVPIGLNLRGVGEVLWAEQTSADPAALRVHASVKGKQVELSGALLNPEDWFTFEVAVVPEPGNVPRVEPIGRIAGVKTIEFVQVAPSSKAEDSWHVWLERGALGLQTLLVGVMLGLQVVTRFYFRRNS